MSSIAAENPPDPALFAAFWNVVALRGWPRTTMRAVSAEAGVPLDQLRRRFRHPLDILLAFERAVDEEVLAGTVDDAGSTPRDRLFDVLMRRLDALQPHRAGILRLAEDLPWDPVAAAALAARLPLAMGWTLEAADIPANGPKGAVRAHGLGLVWLDALRAWRKDSSQDLSATMAALDKALDRADRAARALGLGGASRPLAETKPQPEAV
jgi:AcrR family transcriptional regulator